MSGHVSMATHNNNSTQTYGSSIMRSRQGYMECNEAGRASRTHRSDGWSSVGSYECVWDITTTMTI